MIKNAPCGCTCALEEVWLLRQRLFWQSQSWMLKRSKRIIKFENTGEEK